MYIINLGKVGVGFGPPGPPGPPGFRYSNDGIKETLHLSTLLDPRFRKHHLNPEEQVFAEEKLKGMVSKPSIVKANEETKYSTSSTWTAFDSEFKGTEFELPKSQAMFVCERGLLT